MTISPPARLPFAAVLNPQAGRGLARREWPRLRAELERRGLAYELLPATHADIALAQVQALPPGQPVLAVGGDGTVGALLPALVGTGRPLAIIPLGSGNDFAGMLGLKPGQFDEALGRLRYQPRQVDALAVDILEGDQAGLHKLLLNGLGTGMDAQVTNAYLRAPERLPGFWRYVWGAAVSVRDLKLAGVTVTADGRELYRGRSALAAVMNGTRYGGGFHISPLSDARDGLLNAVCSGPLSHLQLVQLMLKVLPGKHLGHPRVFHGTGKVIEVCWDAPMFLHLDGDLYGQVKRLRARVLPGAVTLLNG